MRSEVEKEKRLSRPSSGQFSSRSSSTSVTLRGTGSSGSSSNRDSVGTTDSSVSEEDVVPPPIPVKQRSGDYCNLPTNSENTSFLYSQRNSTRTSIQVTMECNFDDVPPTPPPKPPKNKNI